MLVGDPFASGRCADVFALGEHRVLRRYRNGGGVAVAASVMGYLDRADYPCQRCTRLTAVIWSWTGSRG